MIQDQYCSQLKIPSRKSSQEYHSHTAPQYSTFIYLRNNRNTAYTRALISYDETAESMVSTIWICLYSIPELTATNKRQIRDECIPTIHAFIFILLIYNIIFHSKAGGKPETACQLLRAQSGKVKHPISSTIIHVTFLKY
jgi:hypothetical protein